MKLASRYQAWTLKRRRRSERMPMAGLVRRPALCIALAAGLLAGCGGVARNGGGSNIEVYGTIDTSIERVRTR